jgi:hypothetical protein
MARPETDKDSVSGEVHGNFAARLVGEAGVRAPNRDHSSLAATKLQRGRPQKVQRIRAAREVGKQE